MDCETKSSSNTMAMNSFQNYFSVSIEARNTEQTCLLCNFPTELLEFVVNSVTDQIKTESSKDVSQYEETTFQHLLELKLGLLSLLTTCFALYHKSRGVFC